MNTLILDAEAELKLDLSDGPIVINIDNRLKM
jgi:hypothetical protein